MHDHIFGESRHFRNLIASVLAGLVAVSAANADGAGPDGGTKHPAVAVPDKIDLGTLAPADVAESGVWIINSSENDLHLIAVKGDCGCITLPAFEPVIIAAHRAVAVPFSIKASKEDGVQKTRKLTFLFDDQSSITVPVSIESDADQSSVAVDKKQSSSTTGVIAAPEVLAFGEVDAASTQPGLAWLINTSPEPRKILAAKGECGCITLHDFAHMTLATHEARQVRFTIKAPDEPGKSKRTAITFQVAGAEPLKLPITMEAKATTVAGATASVK